MFFISKIHLKYWGLVNYVSTRKPMARFLHCAKSALVWDRVKYTLSECCNIRKMADIIYHDEYKELVQVDNSLKMVTIFLAE